MKICKIPQDTAMMMLRTLDQIQITPGVDNADMYVGIGLMLRNAIDNAVEETEEEGPDGG